MLVKHCTPSAASPASPTNKHGLGFISCLCLSGGAGFLSPTPESSTAMAARGSTQGRNIRWVLCWVCPYAPLRVGSWAWVGNILLLPDASCGARNNQGKVYSPGVPCYGWVDSQGVSD